MQVVNRRTLRSWQREHPNVKDALDSWYHSLLQAYWLDATDVAKDFPLAGPLDGQQDRVAFTIQGTDYRLIVSVSYQYKVVFCEFFGTQAAYDAITPETKAERSC